MTTIDQALAAWGDYDRDDPFPLFAQVRALGAGARGHAGRRARGLARRPPRRGPRRAQRPAAVEGHARRARRRAARSWPRACPGPAFARHMLVVDPPDHTRLRRLVVRRVLGPPDRAAAPARAGASSTTCSTASPREDPTAAVDLVASFAFPLPFTVICELLGVPGADRAAVRAVSSPPCSRRPRRRRSTRGRSRRPTPSSRMLDALVEDEAARARRRSRQRVDRARATATSGSTSRSCSRRSSS